MIDLSPVELVGYAASLLIVCSLAMRSVVKLRAISFVGSCTFLVYGVLIESVPIVLTNLAIALINVWYLRQELGLRHDLAVTPVPADSPFLVHFLSFHIDDIRRFQPKATVDDLTDGDGDTVALLLTRDGLPAGVVLGRRHDHTLDIRVDYVLPPYRDSRLGSWLFGDAADVFRAAGFTRLVTEPGSATHRSYLAQVGFRETAGQFELELRPQPAR